MSAARHQHRLRRVAIEPAERHRPAVRVPTAHRRACARGAPRSARDRRRPPSDPRIAGAAAVGCRRRGDRGATTRRRAAAPQRPDRPQRDARRERARHTARPAIALTEPVSLSKRWTTSEPVGCNHSRSTRLAMRIRASFEAWAVGPVFLRTADAWSGVCAMHERRGRPGTRRRGRRFPAQSSHRRRTRAAHWATRVRGASQRDRDSPPGWLDETAPRRYRIAIRSG